MAAGFKSGGKDFKPGQSGNPKGSKPIVPDRQAYKKEAKEDIEKTILKYFNMTVGELQKNITGNQRALDASIIAILVGSINRGDYKGVGFLMERLIGKIKETPSGSDNSEASKHRIMMDILKKYRESK